MSALVVLPGFGRRQLRPTVADHVPARHGLRQPWKSRCWTRACIPAIPAAARAFQLPHPAPSADRLEDSATGRLLPRSFHCEIPAERIEQAHATAKILGDEVWRRFPWSCGADGGFVLPTTTHPEEALLNSTWRPTLPVTGAEGLPPLSSAGNVLRPRTAFSCRCGCPRCAGSGRRRAGTGNPRWNTMRPTTPR